MKKTNDERADVVHIINFIRTLLAVYEYAICWVYLTFVLNCGMTIVGTTIERLDKYENRQTKNQMKSNKIEPSQNTTPKSTGDISHRDKGAPT